MEFVFNELSINPICDNQIEANSRMETFVKAISIARKNGIRNIRSHFATNAIPLAENYSLHDWMFNKSEISSEKRSLMYGMIILPFIKDEDEEIENNYINSNFFFEDLDAGILKTNCTGLAAAFLYQTPSISLSTHPVWEKVELRVIIENDYSNEDQGGDVLNISSEESFSNKKIQDFFEEVNDLSLLETEILPEDKKIHLADHHGKKELKALCNQLKNNAHVIEMRSMEWCQGKCDKFIKKIHSNGVIELVLHKIDKKYGLWVQTTGTNLRETTKIAEILTSKYS